MRKSVRMYCVIASAKSGYIEKALVTIFSYRCLIKGFWDGGCSLPMGVLELQRLYTLVLNLDSTKFVAFESFWDLDYQINLLNSIRRSLKVKMIEARTSRHC